MRKQGIDQLCSYCTADHCLCFHYKDSTIPSLLIPKISRFWLSSVTVQAVFMSDLVGSPEDWFSRAAAHLIIIESQSTESFHGF